MADIVRNAMEAGISVTDLIVAAIQIAHLEYPFELVSHRDEIIQNLYVGVQCVECNKIGKEHVGHTAVHETEEAQDSLIDQGKDNVSGLPEAVVEENNDKEEPSEKRTGLKVVISLKKYKNLPAKATDETPKSANCEAKKIKSSNSTGHEMVQLEKLSLEATEGPKSKMGQFQNIVPESEDEEFIQRFENAKRKLQDNYDMAASAKKQRTVKLVSTNEVPKQGTGILSRKGVVRTQTSSTSNVGRGKVLPKRDRASKLQMLRKTLKSRF